MKRHFLAGVVIIIGLALVGCRSSAEPLSRQIGITNLDIFKIPDGVPAEAQVTFFGKPGKTYPVRREPITEEGTLYVYDDTTHQLVFTHELTPDNPAVGGDLDPSHDYRGFFMPAR